MSFKKWFYVAVFILAVGAALVWTYTKYDVNPRYSIGQPVDSLNGVYVYFNGPVGNISGRNLTDDGYNLGLKYQCVEFVKRYYFEYLNHKMPDSYGHAKDFFDPAIKEGKKNKRRDLLQFVNPGSFKPEVNDLLVYKGTDFNPYGHVSIVSAVTDSEVEIIQQNPGQFGSSRVKYDLTFKDGKWKIESRTICGWLRKEK